MHARLQRHFTVCWQTAFAALILLALPLAAPAQDSVDGELIAQLEQAVSEDGDLSDEKRSELLGSLSDASAALARIEEERQKQAELQDAIDNTDRRVADYREQVSDIEGAPQTVEQRLGPRPDFASIEAEIAVVESQRSGWTRERTEALDAIAASARTEAEVRERLAEVASAVEELAPAGESIATDTLEQRVEFANSAAQAVALRETEKRLRLQVRGAPAINSIRTAKVAWLDAAIAEADDLLESLRAAAADRRQDAASQRRAETRRILGDLGSTRPELAGFADTNLALISDQQGLADRIETARQALASTRETNERIEQDAKLTERRLEVAGLAADLGEVMLTRLASLPTEDSIARRGRDYAAALSRVSMETIDTEQALRERADSSLYLTSVLGPRENWSDAEKRVARQLFTQQRDLLRENLQAQTSLLQVLVDANQAAKSLVTTINDYRDFLRGNLLWTRNYAYLDLSRLEGELLSLVDLTPVTDVASLVGNLGGDPAGIVMLLLLAFLTVRRREHRQALKEMLGKPIRPRDESPKLIFLALLLTLARAVYVPLAIIVVGRLLLIVTDGGSAPNDIAMTLNGAAIVLSVLNLVHLLGGRRGTGRRLLKWNAAKVDAITRFMPWLRSIGVAATAAFILGHRISPTDSGGILAAAGSIVLAFLLFASAVSALRSGNFAGDRMGLWLLRITAALSGAIMLMHVSGQLFAAHQYLYSLVISIGAVVFVLLVVNVLQRLLLIYRMQLQRRAREELREKAQANGEDADGEDADAASEDMDLEALATLSATYTQLLIVGRLAALGGLLWLIWAPALPALGVLEEVTLWTTADETAADGQLRAVTLAALIVSAITLFITAFLVRNLPPLVNLLLLEWTRVSAGGRYATGMLMQYLIIGIGVSVAFGMLGFQWSKLQWLVAALGVGIGFGLQEIVANFISGLIVLFERPIRVGDIINAGGTDGVVRNINPRATVVETFDGKEVMIPNKDLITQVVTNWSLSNPKLRLVIPVGIAYGSDVSQAMKILLDVAKANPEIVDDPEPFVTFEDFGDNALLLWLRCFATRDYPKVSSQLRVDIYRAYEEAGIGISFPQRDVHLDASDPIPVRMVRDGEDAR